MEASTVSSWTSPDQGIDRLAALYSLDLIGGRPAQRFDRIARLASRSLDAPVALVTLMDDDEQYFCAAVGTDRTGNMRADSFCTHAIVGTEAIMFVEDTLDDDRFIDNPVVTHAPHIRFYAGAPISRDGHRVGTLCVLDVAPRQLSDDEMQTLRDLADLVEQELQHTAIALTDELTGLANRRAFEAAAQRFMALGRRRSEPVSVVVGDVNGLKTVNDTSGHVHGDALLRRAAAALSASARSADTVSRIGGDEFAILLYDADDAAAASIVGKIEQNIAMSNELEPDAVPLSISFGVSTSRPDDDLPAFVARADAAMYASKRRLQDQRELRDSNVSRCD